MKKIFVTLLMLTCMAEAKAKRQVTVEHAEICVFNNFDDDAEEVIAAHFKETQFNLKKAKTIDPLVLGMVNHYLSSDEDFKGPYTLKQIQKMYDELYVIVFDSKKTGRRYIEVRAYPGDNPVGVFYDAETGERLANNEDSSYYLVTPEGEIYCGDIKF